MIEQPQKKTGERDAEKEAYARAYYDQYIDNEGTHVGSNDKSLSMYSDNCLSVSVLSE